MKEQVRLIDLEALKQFDELQTEGQPDILVESIDSFLETSGVRLERISSCLSRADAVGAAREAHALKSASLILGAARLSQLCQEIESRSKNNGMDLLTNELGELREVFVRTCEALKRIRERQLQTRRPDVRPD
jgi:HPt (histidine-containing phosphotransfer) domain-containing protein